MYRNKWLKITKSEWILLELEVTKGIEDFKYSDTKDWEKKAKELGANVVLSLYDNEDEQYPDMEFSVMKFKDGKCITVYDATYRQVVFWSKDDCDICFKGKKGYK